MNILQLSLLLAILLKCVTASESGVAQDVIEALEQPGFESIKNDWYKWRNRKDLFDHVVTKSVEFIAGFINQVEDLTRPTLAALFINEPDKADKVLEKIKHNDYDLGILTNYRPELAESHENFFKAIDKIKDPEDQERAVQCSVTNLINDKKHGSVFCLINALEKRQFNGRKLNEIAIQQAFKYGAFMGIKDIVEELHEHPAITPQGYAFVLISSLKQSNSNSTFLVSQADQGDLKEVKKDDKYEEDPYFRKIIDGAIETAPLAGTRHRRFFERSKRVKLAIKTLDEHVGNGGQLWRQGLGSIIASYSLGEQEGATVMEEIQKEMEEMEEMQKEKEKMQKEKEKEKGKCIVM